MSKVISSWSFPFCPLPPTWSLDWESIVARFSWLQPMATTPQEPIYHAEGDVLTHTRMVVQALVDLPDWRARPEERRGQLFAATLLHDVGKPACTTYDEQGRISSRGHARIGEHMARALLWQGSELEAPAPFWPREQITGLIRFHGLPLQFLNRAQPERAIISASQSIRMNEVSLLAEADVRGRICDDQAELLERVILFREYCQELGCYDQPYQFPDAHSRFIYFSHENQTPHYQAYDTTTFEVVLMSGLPGAGKDSWIARHLPDWPVISLDALRRELKILPTDDQGRIVHLAKERARVLLRKQQSFVWNATNLTTTLRKPLIDLFVGYGARVRIVYLDAPWNELLKRNAQREASLPEPILYKFADKLEVPTLTEAHQMEYVVDEHA